MHVIAVDEASRVLLSTQFLAEDPREPVWPTPLFRLQLRTSREAGVILEFYDPRTLQLVASAIRGMLAAHRRATARPPVRRTLRPVARTFDGF
jgi:hypothetical protein